MKKIKVSSLVENGHSLINNVVKGTAETLADAYFVIKIDDLLKERGLTQKKLAEITGMRIGTVSNLVNGKDAGININIVQLLAVMSALRVTDISKIYEIRLPNDLEEEFEQESTEWIADKEMPVSVKEMYRNNILKANGL